MIVVDCPHCEAFNEDAGAFCVACGMALPRPGGKPRVVGAGEWPRTDLGQWLQLGSLKAQVRGGRLVLLIFGSLPIGLGALIFLFALAIENDFEQKQALAGGGVFLVVGFLTLALWYWAGRRPFPATLVGFILYASSVFALFPVLLSESAGEAVFAVVAIFVCLLAAALLVVPVSRGLRYRHALRLFDDREAGQ